MIVRLFNETDANEVSELIELTLRTTNIMDYSIDYIENDINILTPNYLIQRSEGTHI